MEGKLITDNDPPSPFGLRRDKGNPSLGVCEHAKELDPRAGLGAWTTYGDLWPPTDTQPSFHENGMIACTSIISGI